MFKMKVLEKNLPLEVQSDQIFKFIVNNLSY